MPDQVDPAVTDARAAELRAVGERLREQYAQELLGTSAELLVERVNDGVAEGTTGQYLKVSAEADELAPGDIVQVRLMSARAGWVRAELA